MSTLMRVEQGAVFFDDGKMLELPEGVEIIPWPNEGRFPPPDPSDPGDADWQAWLACIDGKPLFIMSTANDRRDTEKQIARLRHFLDPWNVPDLKR